MCAIHLSAQTLQWAKSMGGASNAVGNAIAVDNSGNVYTSGYFVDTVDFDPGVSTFNLISTGGIDIFVSKLDALGNFVWAKQMGGTRNDLGLSIALDAVGNVYTTGFFYETADFDPGATFNLISAGSNDIFVSKLDAGGSFVCVEQMGGAGADLARSIAIDASGNVYTTGYFRDTADFDPSLATSNLISRGFSDIFITKTTSCTCNSLITIINDTTICPGLSVFLGGALQTTSGIYYDSIYNGGCDSLIITTLSLVDTFINMPVFTTSVGCPCNSITFNNTGSTTTYNWDFGDGDTSIASNPTHVYNEPGSYYVRFTGADTMISLCRKKATDVIIVCPGDISPSTSKSNNRWYFGTKAGLDFSSGSPVQVNDGQMTQLEGTATISHPITGDLLFYTDGRNVWDASHNIMPNGGSLAGNVSAVQSVLIIPFPGDTNKYYVFTNSGGPAATPPRVSEIRYSVVDMTLNSGLGDIIAGQKNIYVANGNGGEALSAVEKSPATCQQQQYWLINTPSPCERYEAFLIDNSGVATTPIISTFSCTSLPGNWSTLSRFSPNGRKFFNGTYASSYLLDFNKTTGIFSNIIELPIASYSAEFSPNNRLLYVTVPVPPTNNVSLRQLDITAPNPMTTMTSLGSGKMGTLYIGQDNKIYMPVGLSTGKLTIINNPDIPGTGANYDPVGMVVTGADKWGLQNIVPLNLPLKDTATISANFSYIAAPTGCNTVSFTNTSTTTLPSVPPCSFYTKDTISYSWDFGDGSPVSTQKDPTHAFLSGSYDVSLIINRARTCVFDTMVIPMDLFISDTFADAGMDTTICLGGNAKLVGSGGIIYDWQPGNSLNQQQQNPISTPWETTIYSLRVIDSLGCVDWDTVTVFVNRPPVIFASNDTGICEGNSIMLSTSLTAGNLFDSLSYLWSPSTELSDSNTTSVISMPTSSTEYQVIVTNSCGSDTEIIMVDILNCEVYAPNAFSPNDDGENDLFMLRTAGVSGFLLKVYDRWGNKVYQSQDINAGWDGSTTNNKLANSGVYIYVATGTYFDGSAIDLKGNLTLIR